MFCRDLMPRTDNAPLQDVTSFVKKEFEAGTWWKFVPGEVLQGKPKTASPAPRQDSPTLSTSAHSV